MSNATRPLFTSDKDEAVRLATELALAPTAPLSKADGDGAVFALIRAARSASALAYREELAVRLEFLLDVFNEDYDDEALSADSLRGMLAFLESVPELPCPTVTLTPTGESCASWERGRDYSFNTLFLDAQHVRFYIIYPNFTNASVTDNVSGSTTSDSLHELASYVRLSDWAER